MIEATTYADWHRQRMVEHIVDNRNLKYEIVRLRSQIILCKDELKPETLVALAEICERNAPNIN